MALFRTVPALPAGTDSPVVAFPPEWAAEKSTGLIVEFAEADGRSWVGNFRKGTTTLSRATDHPNRRDVVVVADGAAWIVNPESRAAQFLWPDADWSWLVLNPERLLLSDGRSFVCLDGNGERWRTPPLTQHAGFEAIRVEGERLHGQAWAVLTRTWAPFRINLESGDVYDDAARIESRFDFSRIAGPDQAPPLPEAGLKQLAFIRHLRRAAFGCLLAFPLVVAVLAALNKLTGGATAVFASGAAWTQVFWSVLFGSLMLGVLLAMLTVGRPCPRCQNGFFVSKGYGRDRSSRSRGSVNIFSGRCINCGLPLKG